MDPRRVDVIRSWSSAISVASVGWYPTSDGIRPRSAETSLPAWANRKMLSMNRSTSFPSSSRKYSAIVTPDRPTRNRAPGGSFIWPYTSTVFASTPDSLIPRYNSFPSRDLSPTPANTEYPLCS